MVFIDWFLPGFKAGGPVRSMANMVDHLYNDFDFYIVTRDTEYLEHQPYQNIASNQWNNFKEGVKVFYACEKNCSLKKWRSLIKEVAPNTIYINGIYSPKFSLLPLIAAKLYKKARIIVAPRGMLAESAIHIKSVKKRIFLNAAKLAGLYKGVIWHITNAKEGEDVDNNLGCKGEKITAPNLPKKIAESFSAIIKKPGQLRICSVARIAPEKNTLYALESLLKATGKQRITFDLYGQIYNHDYWKECENVIKQMSENIQINYRGVIAPDEILSVISQYHLLYLPSRGENFGHVILESLMAGRPVLISDQTPWRKLEEKQAGWDLPLSAMSAFTEKMMLLSEYIQEQFDELCSGAATLAQSIVNDYEVLNIYKKMLKGE